MEFMEFSLDSCKSMDRWIQEGKDLYISNQRLSFLEKIDSDIAIALDNLIARYVDALTPEIMEIELSDDDYERYVMQPKALSYDLYNTTELWSALMYINNVTSIAQFKKKKIKVFRPSIIEVIEELLVINELDLKTNRNRIDL